MLFGIMWLMQWVCMFPLGIFQRKWKFLCLEQIVVLHLGDLSLGCYPLRLLRGPSLSCRTDYAWKYIIWFWLFRWLQLSLELHSPLWLKVHSMIVVIVMITMNLPDSAPRASKYKAPYLYLRAQVQQKNF